ncbi:MAG TPA: triose-phosphate isomerase, partial [Roseiflexaceae bacterium]|nr:triose-phosphate isomerase [Roseiflexaceae bacterium]
MRTPLLAGNWKMYKTVSEATALAEALLHGLESAPAHDREVLICPPFTALHALGQRLQGTAIGLGGQDVFYEEQGAFTGAISPLMLRDVGCTYAIVGHSERRQIFGDDDALINRKLHAALRHSLRPILCVGETKPQRDAGQAETIVVDQVRAGLADVDAAGLQNVVIAYEPVWAIGTGDTATPGDAQAMHATIRRTIADLYGAGAADQLRI